MLDPLDPLPRTDDVTLEPLDDFLVIEPLDESETASGLIVPMNEASQCATGGGAAGAEARASSVPTRNPAGRRARRRQRRPRPQGPLSHRPRIRGPTRSLEP